MFMFSPACKLLTLICSHDSCNLVVMKTQCFLLVLLFSFSSSLPGICGDKDTVVSFRRNIQGGGGEMRRWRWDEEEVKEGMEEEEKEGGRRRKIWKRMRRRICKREEKECSAV